MNVISNHPRVGFCCKWINHANQVNGMKINAQDRDLNGRGTTIKWLKNNPTRAVDRVIEIATHNARSAERLIRRVGSLEPPLRMVRLGSEMLPGYTHPDWKDWWQQADVQHMLAKQWAHVGAAARELDVRISFHPGQFVCLASDRPDVADRSLEELEYHVDLARWMGYAQTWQDIKINIHVSGKLGPQGFRSTWKRMSPELRRTLTIENDEITWGLDDILTLGDICPIVLDIHHHLVKTNEYITPQDTRVLKVWDSWKNRRPVIHYSQPRREFFPDDWNLDKKIHWENIKTGVNRIKMRAHNEFYWNRAVNYWAREFWDIADIQCESKAKNLASRELWLEWQRY